MTMASANGLYLPIIFAFGTGLPVILFSYLLAFTAGKIGVFYNRITKIEKVMRTVAGVVFIITGLYYISIFTGLLE
jgi:cytochrome c biogenesis protein CcdA